MDEETKGTPANFSQRRIFCIISPFILMLVCLTFALIFRNMLPIYIYKPIILTLYWVLSLLFVFIGIGVAEFKSLFQKPSGKIWWLVLALLIGLMPLSTFIIGFENLTWLYFLLVIGLALINSFCEEIYWRGFLLNHTFSSKKIACLYSIPLFVVCHFIWGITSPDVVHPIVLTVMAIMAIGWSIITIKTKSVWWAVISHFIVNVFSLSAMTLLLII
ncbi:MAG: CPBP family glutamic-type intramembrane protease [Firmicutes bacterium]|nr:CPBP family glutamic-type intramembrane protease [Bacillota bacterium]